MKLYLCPLRAFVRCGFTRSFIALFLSLLVIKGTANAQELQFKNAILISGTDKADGAVYRFPDLNSKGDIDALVTIKGRSSNLVQLLSIDISNMGFDKAFQPRVTYNNDSTPSGTSDWWMEFQISFVKSGSTTPIPVDSFQVTGLDIDGNNDKINEWVSFYGCNSYELTGNTLLTSSNITDYLNAKLTTVGKRFDGPVENFAGIDTSATEIMATNSYINTNSFRIRTGGHSSGQSADPDTYYSFRFNDFIYQSPSEFHLPLVLLNFYAVLQGSKVGIDWTTGMEKTLNYFIVQRSTDGTHYFDAGIVFANGNTNLTSQYHFTDEINASAQGVIYYRLKVVDDAGRYQFSPICLIRVGDQKEMLKLLAYPNPVMSDLRITIPQAWQNQNVTYEIFSVGGQLVKRMASQHAGQTETIQVQDLRSGVYLVRASNGSESAIQRIVKSD